VLVLLGGSAEREVHVEDEGVVGKAGEPRPNARLLVSSRPWSCTRTCMYLVNVRNDQQGLVLCVREALTAT
jgi:hypothetical protein